ncbi:MAG: M48 family metalloprotease [Myxococcaceae bacterium]
MRTGLLVGGLAVAGLLGCAGTRERPEPTEQEVPATLSNQELQQLGSRLAEQVTQKLGVVDAPLAQQYVNAVGKQLVSSLPAEQQQFEYTFTILNDPRRINAFSLPGGQVFVTSALLEAVTSEAELAAVLTHEIAHGAQGHLRDHAESQYGVPTLRELALGRNPEMLDQISSEIAAQGYLASFSREEEQAADSMGLNLLAQTGYTPTAMSSALRTLAHGEQDRSALFQFFASHPAPDQRAQRLEALMRERGLGGGSPALVGGFERVQAQVDAMSDVG